MSDGNDRAIGVKERLPEEFTRYLVISACPYTCFGAIQRDKAAQLAEQGVRCVPPGFALATALILGKFVLLGESARGGTRARTPTRLRRIEVVAKSLPVLPVLVPLIEAEEVDKALQPGGLLARPGTNDAGARPGVR